MLSMRSAQHQVELRRLGNQLPVLGKANSLCKMLCLACLFRVRPELKISQVIVARAKLAYRLDDVLQYHLVVENIRTPAFYAFSSALFRFFVR